MFIYLFVSYLMFILSIHHMYNTIFTNTLFIIRGISGSGKSHLVKEIETENQLSKYNNINYVELNIYKILKSDDTITSKKLAEAYNKCFYYFINSLNRNINHIYITNPFIYKWEYLNYIELAKSYGYKIKIIELNCQNNKELEICYNRSENVKNYNLLKSQYKQFESDSNSDIYNINY